PLVAPQPPQRAAMRGVSGASRPVATSRLGQQLCAMLVRRRHAIGLTVLQVSSLSRIAVADVEAYEAGAKVPWDHLVVLCRVLGIPLVDLPGFRPDAGTPVQQALRGAQHALAD